MSEFKNLEVIKTTGVINTNIEEVITYLKEKTQEYKGLVITEDNMKDMEATRKELTKGKKYIDDRRKEIKKEYQAPLVTFESKCKEAVELIEDAETEMKDNLDVFYEKDRQKKLAHAKKTADDLAKQENLEPDYVLRLVVDKKEFTNKTMTLKKITADIDDQVMELKRLQTQKHNNEKFVMDQLHVASELAGLSTELCIDDIAYLITDYETMNVPEVTTGITSVAKRHKEAEEEAVRRAEERIRREEEAKARREAEAKLRAEREAEEAKRREEEEAQRAKELQEKQNFADEFLEAMTGPGPANAFVDSQTPIDVDFVVEETDEFEFVSAEPEDEVDEETVVRVRCKKSEAADIIRLLTLNNFDAKLER